MTGGDEVGGTGPAAERMEITVMSVGLGAPRRPDTRVAPAEWPQVLEFFRGTVSRIVMEHGGGVVSLDGDTVLARFLPGEAQPDPVRTALLAARAVIRAVDRLSITAPAHFGAGDLKARAAIHTGEAPVGVPATDHSRVGQVLLQLADRAARLRAGAGPGDILLTGAAADRGGRALELAPVPEPDTGGDGAAYRLVRIRPGRGGSRPRPLVPFVGRRPEMAWLDRQWRAALAGTPRTVVVTGEPGIGKSRLVFELAATIGPSGGRSLTLLCHRSGLQDRLAPLASLMGAVPDSPRAAVSWLQACCAFGPTMLVVEDAQWADPATLEVIRQVTRLEAPLLVVLTARSGAADRLGRELDRPHLLTLDRLPPADTRALADLVLGQDRLGSELVDDLVERGDGVPLFIEELARHASRPGPGERAAVPAGLLEVLNARLERLGETRQVAEMAAVMGCGFDPRMVREVCGLDGEAFEKHILKLLDEAVIEADGGRGGYLRFRHALVHQAVYESLPPGDRERAHSALADALVAAGRAGSEPEVVAPHLAAGGRYGEAVAMWRAAARLARSRSRFGEAAAHERRILALLPHLAEEIRDSVEVKTRSRLGMCLTAVDQADPEILSQVTRAQDLARAYGDERTILDTYLILLPWWQARAEYDAIEGALPEIHDLARRTGDPGHGQALAMVEAGVRIWQGRLAEGLGRLGDTFEQVGLPLRDSLRSMPAVSAPTVLMRCSARVAAAMGLWLAGDARSAWRLVDDTLLFAIERGVAAAQAVTTATAAIMAQLDGDRPRAAGYAAQAEQAAPEEATVQWRRWGAAVRRWADDRPGDIEMPGPMLGPYFEMLGADDPALPPERVAAVLSGALRTARGRGERFCEPEILRLRARAWMAGGDPGRAAADLVEATDTARAQLARSLELRVLTDRVALLGDPGARPRLEQLVASLSSDGPVRSVEEARRALTGA